jgi:hypothetical protein
VTAVTDPLAALVTYLRADASVAALASARVYGGELPGSETIDMPETAVVLSYAGGYADRFAYVELGEPRIDVRCYGDTPYLAHALHRAVHGCLKQMRRNVQGGTMLHCATLESSVQGLRDPDTEWPMAFSSWIVLASERVVA